MHMWPFLRRDAIARDDVVNASRKSLTPANSQTLESLWLSPAQTDRNVAFPAIIKYGIPVDKISEIADILIDVSNIAKLHIYAPLWHAN